MRLIMPPLRTPVLVEWIAPNELIGETEPGVRIHHGGLVQDIDVDAAEQIADGIVEVLATHASLPVWIAR